MSYDATIKGKKKVYFEKNHTSNTYQMFNLAFDSEDWTVELNGLSKTAALNKLNEAINYFTDNKENLILLNSTNGWGSYDSSLNFLLSISLNLNEINNKNVKLFISK